MRTYTVMIRRCFFVGGPKHPYGLFGVLGAGSAMVIRELVREAFVFGFRTIALICAGLSVASAAISAKMITDRDS